MSTIVVGVDGSEGSTKALRFALDEAQQRGANLKVVGAWHIPAIVYEAGWVPANVDLEAYPKFSQEALDKALADADADVSGVEVTTVVHKGQAADVLCAEAKGADLLVVGSRGLGGFRGLMLGSVSQQCAQHTPCPLAIVPNGPTGKSDKAS
jgi:nucleotide-binding universal stress UspA family protein